MSQTRRLGQLYAAESWLNNYRYLVNADFKAYDFETLRTTLLDHIQTNYPEDFNDFINSSEYVALIDLMAFIGQNLAFRSDLNLRETFLETAEVRGNVLSIARQLGYKPFRNGAAGGFLRIVAVNTSQNVYDSKGTNLAGRTIVWGDPLNADFNEQFTAILNQVINASNPIGRPVSSIISNGVSRQIYQISQPENRTMVENFALTARNSTSYPCEIVPVNIDLESQLAVESTPDPYGYLSMLFNNDGTGYANPSNGWFYMFKQGTLKYEDHILDTSVENLVIDVNADSINEHDVWVHSIDGAGRLLKEWVQVSNTTGNNIAFNAINKDTRNIYEVITRSNDAISLKFSDGTFGEIPTGNIRIWYRQSANEQVVFYPQDVAGTTMALRYVDSTGTEQDLICTLQLNDPASSTPSESLTQIKTRASRTAASQDRMITASDYNVYPEGKISGVEKIKSINRTHAGQSIYADVQDPTGTYRPVITYADDAFLYSIEAKNEDSIVGTNSNEEIFNWMENTLLNRALHQLYYQQYSPIKPSGDLNWVTVDSANSSTHGYFTNNVETNQPLRIGHGNPDIKYRTIRKNTLLKTTSGGWIKILDSYREGLGVNDANDVNTGLRANGQGAVFLNDIVASGPIDSWFPSLRSVFSVAEKTDIFKELEGKRNFGLRFDQALDRWRVVRADNIDRTSDFSLAYSGDNTNTNLDASWLLRLDYDSSLNIWTSTIRTNQTIFGSETQLTFHNQRFGKTLDQSSRRVIKDQVKFLKINDNFTKELRLDVAEYFKLDDGRYDPKRVVVWLPGLNETLVPTDPTIISSIVSGQEINLERVQFIDAIGQYTVVPTTGIPKGYIGPVSGMSNLKVQYNHVPLRDNRVDVTTTNIIDMFVLTSEYNTALRTWIAAGTRDGQRPIPLTSYELSVLMADILPYKSVSDSVIFHPSSYKLIFGNGAALRDQCRIRVTKSDGTRISDAEIKSRIIEAIDSYFEATNWDFGESFFFTEMASWVHKKLGGIISSIALIPTQRGLTSNDMFQIRCEDNELLISSATVNEVDIITSSMLVTSTPLNF
jgi:hypothetical protein